MVYVLWCGDFALCLVFEFVRAAVDCGQRVAVVGAVVDQHVSGAVSEITSQAKGEVVGLTAAVAQVHHVE